MFGFPRPWRARLKRLCCSAFALDLASACAQADKSDFEKTQREDLSVLAATLKHYKVENVPPEIARC